MWGKAMPLEWRTDSWWVDPDTGLLVFNQVHRDMRWEDYDPDDLIVRWTLHIVQQTSEYAKDHHWVATVGNEKIHTRWGCTPPDSVTLDRVWRLAVEKVGGLFVPHTDPSMVALKNAVIVAGNVYMDGDREYRYVDHERRLATISFRVGSDTAKDVRFDTGTVARMKERYQDMFAGGR